jgi:hypothetical protein
MRRIVLAALLTLAPLAARAEVSLGLEATLAAPHLGIQRMPVSGHPLTATGDFGGDALLRLWFVGLGAAVDRNAGEEGRRFVSRSALGGFILEPLPFLRVELLGELGNADAGAGPVRFKGARHGLSLRVPKFPLRVGVWGLARWGLPDHAPGRPAYGLLFRAGIEL